MIPIFFKKDEDDFNAFNLLNMSHPKFLSTSSKFLLILLKIKHNAADFVEIKRL
jgi:hypothetical protein